MWLAFHCADAVNVGENFSAVRPIAVRCWLMRLTTCAARFVSGAGQPDAIVQLPVAAALGGIADGTIAVAHKASRRTSRGKRMGERRRESSGDRGAR